MIIGDLREVNRYFSLHLRMRKVFEYASQHDFTTMKAGRIELDAKQLFINLEEVELKEKDEQLIEVHRKYIDVHIPLIAEEAIGWKALVDLGEPDIQYDEDKDFAFYQQLADQYFHIKPGQFAICFPEDGHAPLIGIGKQRKLIAKILI